MIRIYTLDAHAIGLHNTQAKKSGKRRPETTQQCRRCKGRLKLGDKVLYRTSRQLGFIYHYACAKTVKII